MTRRRAQSYTCPSLERLSRQLLFAPPEHRVEQVRRAERLHDEIEAGIDYPYEFVAYRITGYRSQEEADTLLAGRAILPDLRLMIDTVSRTVDWRAGPDDGVDSLEELAKRLNVNPKTVTRWRQAGLRWRWMMVGSPPRRRLVFPRAGVERFQATNAARVDRAARFARMTPDQREQMLKRARRIAEAAEVSLNQVATHLARRTGRAVETLRLLLEQHDTEHADNPIFADRTKPLTATQKRVIARAYRMGVSVGKMTRHFRRTRPTIYRVIHERRAAALRQYRIEFVALPTFTRPDADEVLLRPEPGVAPGEGPGGVSRAAVEDLPEAVRPLFLRPGLEAVRQISLLVRYNYLKFKAQGVLAGLDRLEPRAAEIDQVERYLRLADGVADRLLLANTPVLLSVVRRHLVNQADQSAAHLMELLTQGQEVLVHGVETFDPTRGQTFEAYLTWLLMRRFATRLPEPRAKAHRRAAAFSIHPRLQQAMGGERTVQVD